MERFKNLTPREIEVVQLLAQGLKNKEIGKKLYISEATVKSDLENIYKKLNIHNRVLVAVKACTEGLVKVQV